MSAEALFLQNLELIERVIRFVVRRHPCSRDDAEEFASEVRLRLIEDDYAVLRKFAGRSSLRTYLTTVVLRLFLDYRARKWGRWRPSAAARRLGAGAIELERLLSRDGHPLEEACAIAVNRAIVPTLQAAVALASRLPTRVERRIEGEEVLANLSIAADTVQASLLQGEAAATAARIRQVLADILDDLPPDERVMVRLRFDDGLAVGVIARMFHVEEKALYKRFDRTLERLRDLAVRAGVSVDDVRAALETAGLEWGALPSSRKGLDEGRPILQGGTDAFRGR